MPVISISEPLQINAIVWISSLPQAEQGTSRRMLDDLVDLAQSGGFPVFERPIATREELWEVLAEIRDHADRGLRPILHFDTHGNPDDGVYIAPTGEWAAWSELMDWLRAINVATGNNLVVVLALCFGLNLYKLAELKKPAPAYLFAAAPKKVTVGFLLDEVPAFYKAVQTHGSFLEPFETTLGKAMNLINCQGLFLQALAHYVKTQCDGEVLTERTSRTAAAIFARDGIVEPTDEQIEEVTNRVRQGLAPSEKIIAQFAPEFLIGRQPLFTWQDVEAVAGQRTESSAAG